MRNSRRLDGEPTWWQLAGYGLPALPLALLSLPFYVIVPSHYATLGVPIAVVGQVLLAIRLFDAFSDPIAGHLSDRTRSRFVAPQTLVRRRYASDGVGGRHALHAA